MAVKTCAKRIIKISQFYPIYLISLLCCKHFVQHYSLTKTSVLSLKREDIVTGAPAPWISLEQLKDNNTSNQREKTHLFIYFTPQVTKRHIWKVTSGKSTNLGHFLLGIIAKQNLSFHNTYFLHVFFFFFVFLKQQCKS